MRIERPHQAADERPRATHRRRDEREPLQIRGEIAGDATPGIPLGPGFLTTLPADIVRKRFRCKRPDFLKGDIVNNADRLLKCADSYVTSFGRVLRQRTVRNSRDMSKIMREMNDAGGVPVELVHDDTCDALRLFRGGTINNGTYIMYIEPAYHFKEPARNLILRFLKTCSNGFGMADFMGTIYFDWTQQDYEWMKDELKRSPENFEMEDAENIESLKDYDVNGIAYNRLQEFHYMKPLTAEELKEFKAETPAEEEIVRMMQEGFNIINTDKSIWDWATPTYDECYDSDGNPREEFCGDGLVTFDNIFTVAYDDDYFMKQYLDKIEAEENSGMMMQDISDWQEIVPEGKIKESDYPRALLEFIDRWNRKMDKTIERMEEKKNADSTQ